MKSGGTGFGTLQTSKQTLNALFQLISSRVEGRQKSLLENKTTSTCRIAKSRH